VILRWDRTEVSFKVKAEIDEKIMKAIEKEMNDDRRPYYAAANYYFENGKDLNKALEWVNKAIEMRPDAFWMHHTKAKILNKLKDYNGAIAAAEKSLTLAKEADNDTYVKNNEKLIAEIKAKPDYKPVTPPKKK
jgi:tetratricopeptide (TPR) repeat protein